MSDDLTACGPWRVERTWHKHHERIPDRWEWVIEDDAGGIAYLPEDDDNTEAVARAMASVPELLARIAELEAWKDSASSVLAQWDETWRAAGEPGPLGQSKAGNVRRRIDSLSGEVARLTAERDEALAEVAQLRAERSAALALLDIHAKDPFHPDVRAALRGVLAVSEEATDV